MNTNQVTSVEFSNDNEHYCRFNFESKSLTISKKKYEEILLLFGQSIEVNNSYHEQKFTEYFCITFPISYFQACKYDDLVKLINGEITIGYICWVLDSIGNKSENQNLQDVNN